MAGLQDQFALHREIGLVGMGLNCSPQLLSLSQCPFVCLSVLVSLFVGKDWCS